MSGTKKLFIAIFSLSICCSAVMTLTDPPQAKITNGQLTASLFLPDSKNGYYRGTRFDWSGQISSLQYQGHEFFGKWFDQYDPLSNDAIMGPVEAFDPVGYEDAPTGGRFIKIGVGALIKPEEKSYFFANTYTLINPGKWEITHKPDKIIFTHTLYDSLYSYRYVKTISLLPGKPTLEITHTLENTGSRIIETQAMNHNFFVIDGQPTGSDFTVSFPYRLNTSENMVSAVLKDNQIVLEGGNPEGKNFFIGDIKGYDSSATDYSFSIANTKTGAGAEVRANKPIAKLNFWASDKTICPEPYIRMKIEPRKKFHWTITYQFHANSAGIKK